MRLQSPSTTGALAARQRYQVQLADPDGVTREFFLPEPAIQTPPLFVVRVYHNGRRLTSTEHEITESIPGSGFDTVKFFFTPNTRSRVLVDYFAA